MTQPAHTDHEAQPSKNTTGRLAGILDGFLTSPFAGIAPWALLSILATPGRFEIAAVSALGFSVLVMLVGLARGIKIHALEVFGAAFFAALAAVGLFASDTVIRFLEMWSGELTNIALAMFAWLTLLLRRPFTLAYAKDITPQEHWDSPLFKRINNVITAGWAGAFTFAAGVGLIGNLILHDPENFWTGWILQLAAIFFAVAFTEFYPDYASAMFALDNGEEAQVPSILQAVEWLPTFAVVAGVVGLITGSVGVAVAIAMIVGGSVVSGILAKL
ncbi:MAG: hypothetical protein HYX31_25360 [Mycobacterium sp.]|jgi:hypothetical protein|uniref:hypothetical protein n=1 Tax=Mycobacterium gordonae TaxID=1778 RepID=UPI0012EA202C|nr:hypothetical protein [Mycobacterium gordonae]MBI2702406.1 hypothetical protein [Mycobacterium sp.]